MKNTSFPLAAAAAICIAASPSFSADKRQQPKPMETDNVAINAIKSYDKDHNFEIDLKEFEAVKAAFKSNPTGPLKQFDKGGDGVLDETVDRASMNIKLAAAKLAPKDDDRNSRFSGKKRKKK